MYESTRSILALVFGVGLSPGCESPGGRSADVTPSTPDVQGDVAAVTDVAAGDEIGVTPDTGTTIPAPLPVPAECLPGNIPCVTQEDCTAAAGTRCNTALAEPMCQTIRCGTEGTACSDHAHCAQGMFCQPDRCGACTPMPEDSVCVDGQVVCQEGLARCGLLCVDLQSDPRHCGDCNVPVPDFGHCESGAVRCPVDWGYCDGRCEQLVFMDHCGGCNLSCEFLRDFCRSEPTCEEYHGCDEGMCEFRLIIEVQEACDVVCGAFDAACVDGLDFVVGSGFSPLPCTEPAEACDCALPPVPSSDD